MKTEPPSAKESNLPYIANCPLDLPASLQKIVSLVEAWSGPWLAIPYEGVGHEPFQECALRVNAEGLVICLAVPCDGYRVIKIAAEDCTAIQFSNVLLYSELTFFRGNDKPFRLAYNAVGEAAINAVLKPFLDDVFPATSIDLPVGGRTPVTSRLTMRSRKFFGTGESHLTAVQPDSFVSKRSWWKGSSKASPAGTVAVSKSRLVISTDGTAVLPGRYGHTTTCIPLQQIANVSLKVSGDYATLEASFGGEHEIAFSFAKTNKTGVAGVLRDICQYCEQVTNAAAPVLAARKQVAWLMLTPPGVPVSARRELLRLTGVDLPEVEACKALIEIHNFKWLEAERAGFDTWAIIQPENPLRAAAVHWVRKHFSQFAHNKFKVESAGSRFEVA